jgi:hypothetical protein
MWKWALAAGTIIAALIWWNGEREAKANAQREAERAVSELPAGVEEEWLRFIDCRLARTFRPGKGFVVLLDRLDAIFGQTTVVNASPVMPFHVACDPSMEEVEVIFGGGDNGPSVSLSGPMAGARGPDTGVSRHSVAAHRLFGRLCVHATRKVRAILAGEPNWGACDQPSPFPPDPL